MTNLEKLQIFFRAENDRDWTSYADFLHPDVSWELHGIETLVISGKESYLEHIKSAYDKDDNHFTCLSFEMDHLQNRILTFFENVLGLGQRSCDIFDFENGLISKEYEFLLN